MYTQLSVNFPLLTPPEKDVLFQLVDNHTLTLLKLLPGHPLLTHALYNNGDIAQDPVIAEYETWKNNSKRGS